MKKLFKKTKKFLALGLACGSMFAGGTRADYIVVPSGCQVISGEPEKSPRTRVGTASAYFASLTMAADSMLKDQPKVTRNLFKTSFVGVASGYFMKKYGLEVSGDFASSCGWTALTLATLGHIVNTSDILFGNDIRDENGKPIKDWI